jgi:hypothetical protein
MMFRTSGLNTEIVDCLLDRAAMFKLGSRPSRRSTPELTCEARRSGAQSGDPFAHAVQELAALSLNARTILALRS